MGGRGAALGGLSACEIFSSRNAFTRESSAVLKVGNISRADESNETFGQNLQ